jgi:Proline racemase/WD domain, G-beta repeat
MHHWFVSALLASILALVCAMTATARSEGAPFLMLDTGGHQANIWSMAYTPDGRYLISAGDDKAVRVWDLKENKAVRTIRRQSGPGDEDKIDRSPTGTGCSAGMAVLIARGLMAWGDAPAPSLAPSSSAGSRARPRSATGRALCNYFGPGLDYRCQSVYAGRGRSVAVRLPAIGYMAAR